jgi:hypothetical protein
VADKIGRILSGLNFRPNRPGSREVREAGFKIVQDNPLPLNVRNPQSNHAKTLAFGSILCPEQTTTATPQETTVRTLIYKRTHSGDSDKMGCFGIWDCMGRLRNMAFDAVIGVGGSR